MVLTVINNPHKMVPASFSPDYIGKCYRVLKWLFWPFGLNVTARGAKSTGIMKKLSKGLFYFHVIYHVLVFAYYSVAFVVYMRRAGADTLHAVNNFSFILSIPISFITYFVFHVRQPAVSRVFNTLTALPSSKLFSRKNWRLFIFGIAFIVLLHVVFALTSLVLGLTSKHAMEDICVYMTMSTELCEDKEISRKVSLAFAIIDVYEYSTTYFFISLCCIYFSLVCHLIALDLHKMHVELREKVHGQGCLSHSDITELRIKFVKANRMAKTVSHLLSPLLMLWLVYTVFTICTSIRTTITEHFDGVHQLITPTIELIRFYLLFKNASSIRLEVNNITECFATSVPIKDEQSYSHFKFILQSSKTGIAVSGLFVMDSHCVLSVTISIIAYTVIVFETRPSLIA